MLPASNQRTQKTSPMRSTVVKDAPPRSERWLIVGLALLVTLLNALKPFAVDDAIYYFYAEHIAHHPLDPYGFLLWDVHPANNTLAPPVFLYWFAAAVRLFGPNPFLWKLWLLPINLLFVFALHALGRRFAPGRQTLFVVFLALSAVFLPNINLMLDVPALALGLSALALFFRACDRDSWRWLIGAGLVAGLAMQTKYTALVAPAAMVLYSLHARKPLFGLLAALTAVSLFAAWESVVAFKYGASHFLIAVGDRREPLARKFLLVQPLFGLLGGLLALALPLALATLRAPGRVVWLAAAAAPAIVVFLALPEGPALDWLNRTAHLYPTQKLTAALFGVIGAVFAGALALVAYRLLTTPSQAESTPARRPWLSEEAFLIGWLLLELGGYFALSPFAAARRVMGVSIVATLLICRLASRTGELRAPLLWKIAGLNAAYGLLLFAADLDWYSGHQKLIVDAVHRCRQENSNGRVWHFLYPASADPEYEFHAHQLGTRRLDIAVPAAPAPGDWVLVIDAFGDHLRRDETSQAVFRKSPTSARCVETDVVEWRPLLPVRSQLGASNVPVTRWMEPPLRVVRYRVQSERVASTPSAAGDSSQR